MIMHLYGQLKPRERELLNLRYVTELKDKEIASLLHLPEKTVNKRLQRLLSKCRLILHNMEQEKKKKKNVSKVPFELYIG